MSAGPAHKGYRRGDPDRRRACSGIIEGLANQTPLILGATAIFDEMLTALSVSRHDPILTGRLHSVPRFVHDPKNQRNFRGLVSFIPWVCFCLAIEVLHEHRAGDDQRDDQLVRACGGHRPSYTSLNRKRVSTDVRRKRAARFVSHVCRKRP
jgi:hypothetical protein